MIELPLLPVVTTNLLLLKDGSDLKKIALLASSDPALLVRLIELLYNELETPPEKIEDISNIVNSIGVERLSKMLHAIQSLKLFVPQTREVKYIWLHSIQVAIASQVFAKLNPELNISPNKAYLCGLLHDIGRFILYDQAPQLIDEIQANEMTHPQDLIRAEKNVLGGYHTDVGAETCRLWGLPEFIVETIQFHHDPEQIALIKDSESRHIATIVRYADLFSMAILKTPEEMKRNKKLITSTLSENFKDHLIDEKFITLSSLEALSESVYQQAYNQYLNLELY